MTLFSLKRDKFLNMGGTNYQMQAYDAGKKILYTKGEKREAGKKEFIDALKVLEGELGDKQYFGGDTFGFVDLSLVPLYSVFYAFETFGEFSIEAEYPKIIAWAKRCLQRKSVSETLPDGHKVFDFVSEMLKKLGTE